MCEIYYLKFLKMKESEAMEEVAFQVIKLAMYRSSLLTHTIQMHDHLLFFTLTISVGN